MGYYYSINTFAIELCIIMHMEFHASTMTGSGLGESIITILILTRDRGGRGGSDPHSIALENLVGKIFHAELSHLLRHRSVQRRIAFPYYSLSSFIFLIR